MSGNTRIGWSGTTLKEQMGSPIIDKTAAGSEVTEIFTVDYANAESAITARGYTFGAACPIAGGIYSDSKLDEIKISAKGPRQGFVRYIWKPVDPDSPTPPVGRITYEADANAIDIPIGQNPNASEGTNYDVNKKIGKGDWEGIEAFFSPQPTFGRTEILGSFTFSEANIIENVAKRYTGAQMNAVGMSAASDNKWLKTGRSIKQSGTNYEQVDRWQYADSGWNTDIYEGWS